MNKEASPQWAAAAVNMSLTKLEVNFGEKWRPHGDSNPGYSRERGVS